MRLGLRTTLATLLIAAIPVSLGGWRAINLSNSALESRAGHLHQTVARLLAEKIQTSVEAGVENVRLAGQAHLFSELSPGEQLGALRLIYRQVDMASAVLLANEKGHVIGEVVFLSEPADDPGLVERPASKPADVTLFQKSVPVRAALQVGAAISQPYVASDGMPRLSIATRTRENFVLAVEITLAPLIEIVETSWFGDEGRTLVVDDRGLVILDNDREAVQSRADRSGWLPVRSVLEGAEYQGAFLDRQMGDVLGASAKVSGLNWAVVVAEPTNQALAAADAVERQALWGLLLALVGGGLFGVVLSRALVRPIRRLHAGASALERGQLAHRVEGSDRADELGDLARAFNKMAEEVERWNRELEQRVLEKTTELERAQNLLVRTQKLAAVGQLGAGVAHEINNPLAGVLGMAQLLLMKEPKDSKARKQIEKIEQQALRIREIVENLRQLAEGESAALKPTSVCEALEASLARTSGELEQRNIDVVKDIAEVPDVVGDPGQLKEVFYQLIDNARAAMPEGGKLSIVVRALQGQLVSVEVQDEGSGIPPELHARIFEPFFTTKSDWNAKGLGLSLVNRVVETHHGEITVKSEPGKGSTFTVILPVAQQRSLE